MHPTGSPAEIERIAAPSPRAPLARVAARPGRGGHALHGFAVRHWWIVLSAGLLGAAVLAWTVQIMSAQGLIEASWRRSTAGAIELAASADPALASLRGAVLHAVTAGGREVRFDDASALKRSARWLIDDDRRNSHPALQVALSEVLEHERIGLDFAQRGTFHVSTHRRGWNALPGSFWVLSLFALGLAAAGALVCSTARSAPARLYAVMTTCQAGNLLAIACESVGGPGIEPAAFRLPLPLHLALDLATAAAFVHLAAVYPRRLARATQAVVAAWGGSAVLLAAVASGRMPGGWWWIQGAVAACGVAGTFLAARSHADQPATCALVLHRFGLAATATWLMLTATVAGADGLTGISGRIASLAPTLAAGVLGALLLAAPLLHGSQPGTRRLAWPVAVGSIAVSLDLLFVSVLGLEQLASLTLASIVSLAVYAGARHWFLDPANGTGLRAIGSAFEHLDQTLRQVELHPQRATALLAQLLRRVFEPVELQLIDARSEPSAGLVRERTAIVVPLPPLCKDARHHALLLSRPRGNRPLFTRDDARLAERIAEQLQRALRLDCAFEQGRTEERSRLAQDLHDDIGARLLTLIYEAPTPEMQASLRRTLQDLKTVTRGLAATQHRLGDAAAEWRADLASRFHAAQIEFGWHTALDADPLLGVVASSALTRIIRELASNAIAHAHASRVDIEIELTGNRLRLTFVDDGCGRAPGQWANGLGLAGVRKRVHQLGGSVQWLEVRPAGISCEVTVLQVKAAQAKLEERLNRASGRRKVSRL